MSERLTERKLRIVQATLAIMKKRAENNGKDEEAILIGKVMGCVLCDIWGLSEGYISGKIEEKLDH